MDKRCLTCKNNSRPGCEDVPCDCDFSGWIPIPETIKLSYGQIQNLYKAMPLFSCKVCGDEQKVVCNKEDECQLITWVVGIEKEYLQESHRKFNRALMDKEEPRKLTEEEKLLLGIC